MTPGADAGQQSSLEASIWRWLDEAVIGLNLCPFAAAPRRRDQIRLVVLAATDESDVLSALSDEMAHLDSRPASELDTTLVAVPDLWPDFLPFNDFLDETDALLADLDRVGVYQFASFHPHYQFAGTQPGDPENLTNAAPCALLHILREDSLTAAVERYPNPDAIPEDNQRRLRALSDAERQRRFPWMY